MRYFLLLVFLWNFTIYANDIKVTFVDELSPLYPDSEITKEQVGAELHVAKGSVAGIHVIIQNLPIKEIINLKINTKENFHQFKAFKLIDVPVEINTGIESRTEKWDGKHNPNVIRRAPFQIYEVLQPIEFPDFANQNVTAYRLQWDITGQIEKGIYPIKLNISGLEFEKNLELTIQVYDILVPPTGKDSYGYTNWFSLSNIARMHQKEVWSEAFWDVLKKYADMMYYGRQNTFWVPIQQMFEFEANEPILNVKRLEKYVSVFKNAGLYFLEFSPFSFRTNNDWSISTLTSSLKNDLLVTSKDGKVFHDKIFSQLKSVIHKNNWQNCCRLHIADEPTDVLVNDYKKFVKHLRKYFPDIPIMEATMTQELKGVINIWTPQLHEFQAHQKFFQKLKKKKASIWIYSCLVPGGKWLNRLIDQERLRQVYIGWSLPYYSLDGFLHWGLNHYNTPNPFIRSVVDHPQAPDTNNQLPAGDTHVLYPGLDAPWSSTRFEAHRIGLEDAELWQDYFKKDKKKAKSLMNKCFKACDDYQTLVELYRGIKKELLKALEK